jgi:hypothetical protein
MIELLEMINHHKKNKITLNLSLGKIVDIVVEMRMEMMKKQEIMNKKISQLMDNNLL